MAHDDATADRVRRALADRPGVAERRMVGGLSFLVDGTMCLGVTGSALMVRVGPEARDRVLAHRHVRPMELGGKQLAGFVLVDPPGYRTDSALQRWIDLGIDFASTLPPKPSARSPKQSTRGGAAGQAEQLFERIRRRVAGQPDVSEGTGFGTNPGLRVGPKIFAMLNGDRLVVKLPRDRVNELVEAGVAARFDPRRDGRVMKEWATIPAEHGRRWGRLAEEALRFVRGAAKPR